jgi:hypothetical protein
MAKDVGRDPVEWWRSFPPEQEQKGNQPDLFEPERQPKRWNRASLDMKTHPLHPFPNVRQRDLLVPLHADRLKLFGACLVCGAGLSVLWVYLPLMLIGIPLGNDFGIWKWVGMGAFAAAVTVALFLYASAKEAHYLETL